MTKTLSAHMFPEVYKDLNIDLAKLGCVMLDLEGVELSGFSELIQDEVTGAVVNWGPYLADHLYYAKDPSKFWVKGWVLDDPHITLLYGLLSKPGLYEQDRKHVDAVLEGVPFPSIRIKEIGHFDSPYEDEQYYCVVAHVDITPELQEIHDRLTFLPHCKTFPGYKAHVSIAYVKKESGLLFLEELKTALWHRFVGLSFKPKGLNYGGDKG